MPTSLLWRQICRAAALISKNAYGIVGLNLFIGALPQQVVSVGVHMKLEQSESRGHSEPRDQHPNSLVVFGMGLRNLVNLTYAYHGLAEAPRPHSQWGLGVTVRRHRFHREYSGLAGIRRPHDSWGSYMSYVSQNRCQDDQFWVNGTTDGPFDWKGIGIPATRTRLRYAQDVAERNTVSPVECRGPVWTQATNKTAERIPRRPLHTQGTCMDASHRQLHKVVGNRSARGRLEFPNRELGPAFLLELIPIYDILGLQRKEATTMGTLRFVDLRTRPTEVLDLTTLTVSELQPLVTPFESAFQAHMAHWRLDGRPRTARRYPTYTNCPLPTPEDRL
jgi:hypothetical protein